MKERCKRWGSGAVVAAASMALYAIALGFFLALTLLVISMEEGGSNLSQLSIPLTEAVILLSLGSGFKAGSITLSVIPLLLTLLLIALIASIARRRSCESWDSYVAGAIVWLALTFLANQGITVVPLDPLWLSLVKSLAVFSVGFAIAVVPGASFTHRCIAQIRSRTSASLRLACSAGIRLGLTLLALYFCIGCITVAAWAVMNHAAMGKVFQLAGMQNGSRILTTICSLAWLPNLCIWATSWVFGGGFHIGELATFTLWVGQSTSLPALPIFGIFPMAVQGEGIRTILVALPMVIAFLAATAMLYSKRFFALRFVMVRQHMQVKERLFQFAYSAGALCVAAVIISVGSSVIFQISNGSLGSQRLKTVGVDVTDSTQALGHPSAVGLLAAWLVALILFASVFLVSMAADHVHTSHRPTDDPDRPTSTRVISSMTEPKEEQDDNKPTDTTSSGIRLP